MTRENETHERSVAARLPPACGADNDPQSPLCRRVHPEALDPFRTPFQRDRGRIIHSRAFRRLAGKTQVFAYRYSDHFRSRLTHTMEVAQIARALAYALGLNEELTEALALAHDIGHPPFGHAGERALDLAMRKFGLRFDHNLHALRIVEYFELRYAAYRGLNLTLGLREGIVKHSKDYSASEHPELREYFLDQRPPLEAQLIDLADEIAYITADMEDGFEAEMLDIEGLSANVELFEHAYRATETQYPNANRKLVFNEALRQILNTLVVDLIENTARNVRANSIESMEQIRAYPERLAALSPAVEALRKQAKQYLYSTLYTSDELQHDLREAATVVTDLFECWVSNPSLLPAGYEAQIGSEGAPRVVADYIAGMTDNFILHQHELWRRGSLPVR